jgi:hypothetical protein
VWVREQTGALTCAQFYREPKAALKNKLIKRKRKKKVLMAHACNPSYSGGRDQEDQGSKPAWGSSSLDHILKKPITKKG